MSALKIKQVIPGSIQLFAVICILDLDVRLLRVCVCVCMSGLDRFNDRGEQFLPVAKLSLVSCEWISCILGHHFDE